MKIIDGNEAVKMLRNWAVLEETSGNRLYLGLREAADTIERMPEVTRDDLLILLNEADENYMDLSRKLAAAEARVAEAETKLAQLDQYTRGLEDQLRSRLT